MRQELVLGIVLLLTLSTATAAHNWVSWAMMGHETPAEERINTKLEEIEQIIKEIRRLNSVPRQLEKIPE